MNAFFYDTALTNPTPQLKEDRDMASAAPNPAAPLYAFKWGPSGHDTDLARAISDLTMGGYLGTTRELLASLGGEEAYDREISFDRRAYCTSVLAARIVQRRLYCDEEWLSQEPKNPDALLLRARVLVLRAVHAARRGGSHSASELSASAAHACHAAADAAPDDPTPWISLLALGEANPLLPELRTEVPAPDGMSVIGPWALFEEVNKRDPHNREASHRLIPLCSEPTSNDAWTPGDSGEDDQLPAPPRARAQVAVWAADRAPFRSPLKLLRLMHSPESDPFPNPAEAVRQQYFKAEQSRGAGEVYAERRRVEIEEQWRLALLNGAIKLVEAWFADSIPMPYTPPADLSFLADYLIGHREHRSAALVLAWLYPHATSDPWRRRGDRDQVLAQAYLDCNLHPVHLNRRSPDGSPGSAF